MNKFWLYLGIILACSGIGTGIGIVLIILYVWEDIKESIETDYTEQNDNEQTNHYDSKYYDDDIIDEMK
jgi:hypothetical protein